jgi:hypothetical protein
VAAAHVAFGMALVKQAAEAGDASARNFLSQCYAEGSFDLGKSAEMSNRWSAWSNAPFIEYGERVDIEAEGIALSKPRVDWSEASS